MRIGIYPLMQEGGSHKNLYASEVLDDAIQNGIDTISVISSGNFLAAIAGEIRRKRSKIKLVNLVNTPLKHTVSEEDFTEVVIKDNRILRTRAERENYVRMRLSEVGKVRDYTDFNACYVFSPLVVSFSHLFTPLVASPEVNAVREHLGYDVPSYPDYISVGVGNGGFFLDLAKTIKRYRAPTKLIGVLPKGENGVFTEESDFLIKDGLLYMTSNFNPRTNADKLSCPYTSFGQQLLDSREEGHIFYEACNNDFERAFNLGRGLGLVGEVSSTAGLVMHDPQVRKRLRLSEKGNLLAVASCGARGEKYKTIFEN